MSHILFASYDVNFVGMVLPGDQIAVTIKHFAMRDGNLVVKVTAANERGEKVLEGTAEVAQPTTVYVFTGQGSQEQGMGMDLYASSPVAKEVWDRADKHFWDNYGMSSFLLIRIVVGRVLMGRNRLQDYAYRQE